MHSSLTSQNDSTSSHFTHHWVLTPSCFLRPPASSSGSYVSPPPLRKISKMVSQRVQRQLKVLTLVVIALLLLTLSASITLSGFAAWHYLSTRPYHKIPLSFRRVPATETKPAVLEAVADLTTAKLRAVANMQATITLSLPESKTNLENSVFQISSDLLSSDDFCVAHASSAATLTFRSPMHRAVRAVVLSVPMLLGFIREYQTVTEPLFGYQAVRKKGEVPRLVAARVKIDADELQIASAYLVLRAGRTSLLSVLTKEGRVSSIVVMTTGLWYCMLFSLALLIACISALKRTFSGLFGIGVSSSGAKKAYPPKYEGKGPPPRMVLINREGCVQVSGTGPGWSTSFSKGVS